MTSVNGVPTGTVVFLVDNVRAAQAALVAGTATLSISPSVGVHTITASYTGSAAILLSNGRAVPVTVINIGIAAYSGSGQSTPYGSLFPAPLTVPLSSSAGTPMAGQTITFLATGAQVSSTAVVTDVNGIASITASAATAGSEMVVATYNGVTGPTFLLTGTKAPLTFAATSASVAVGQPIAKLKYSISGFVNGDGASAFTGVPAESTSAAQGSAAAAYLITIALGTLASTNYSFAFVPGTLTVAAPIAAISIAISVGILLPVPLTVLVKDSLGNPVAGTTVAFAGNGITVSPASALTNANRQALVTAVPTRAGAVSSTATVAGIAATFSETGK